MKKKIVFLVFSFLIISFSASAQFKLGVVVGAPFKLNGLSINDISIENSRPFNLGLMAETVFPPLCIGFEVSALYELERITGKNIVEAVNIGYVIIPVNFKWKSGFKFIKLYTKVGPCFALKLHESGYIELKPEGISFRNFKPKPFNFGFNIGFGFEIMEKVQLGANYFYQFKDPFIEAAGLKLDKGYNMSKNGGFVLSLSYFL